MGKYWDMFVKFIKFNIVGVMNTALDLGIFALLTWAGVGEGLAKTVSYSCGVLNSYFWNSRWTFKQEHKKSAREFLLFVLVNLVSYAVARIVLQGSLTWLHIENANIRNLIATPVSVIVNFIGNRLFVFKKSSGAESK
jgi:putative flippase GtrA